jgi:hypothetical protein
MISGTSRSPRTIIFAVASFFIVAAFVAIVYNHLDAWEGKPRVNPKPLVPNPQKEPAHDDKDQHKDTHSHNDQHDDAEMDDGPSLDDLDLPIPSQLVSQLSKTDRAALQYFIEQIWKPTPAVDAMNWSDFGAFDYQLPPEPKWTKNMGENLCFIDLDNRPFDQPGELFGPERMTWDDPSKVHGLSLGILNHWLYAKIHGYKYYYVTFDPPEDRRASWKKPPIMAKILEHHDACVYMDSDAIIRKLELPFEWLMNYWDIHPTTNSLALAIDPDDEKNKNRFGDLYLNTGFIIAQNNPKTFEIMRAWDDCPNDGGKHPDCTEFRLNDPGKPTDQGGFGTFIRYDYAEDIKSLSCNDANGFPEANAGCDGVFVRHLWTGKHTWIKVNVGLQIPGRYLELVHTQFLAERDSFTFTEEALMAQ